MKIIDTKYGTLIDTDVEIDGVMHTAFASGDHFLFVNKDGVVAYQEYAPRAEKGFKEIARAW